MGPTQPLFGAGGGLGGGNGGGKGGGGGPGGVWGLGLGGVRGLLFLSFRFDSLTLGPVTDELPLELRCFRFRFFFSFSLSSRLPRLLFSLGETLLLSLFFFLSLLTGLSGAASSASASGSGPFFDGSALDLLANRNGFAGSPDFLSGSLLVGFGAGTWEFSTNATLPFALAGVSIGGAFGGGRTRLGTEGTPRLDDDGRLVSLGLGFESGADGQFSMRAVSSDGLDRAGGLSTIFLFNGASAAALGATDVDLGATPSLPLPRSMSCASFKVSSSHPNAWSKNLSACPSAAFRNS